MKLFQRNFKKLRYLRKFRLTKNKHYNYGSETLRQMLIRETQEKSVRVGRPVEEKGRKRFQYLKICDVLLFDGCQSTQLQVVTDTRLMDQSIILQHEEQYPSY